MINEIMDGLCEIEIINAKKIKPSEPYDFCIDRNSPIGSSLIISKDCDRDWVCDKYDAEFMDLLKTERALTYIEKIRQALFRHKKVRLFCWCFPLRCHGETIKAWLIENKIGYGEVYNL